ncbi:MAG: hypothetical protein R2856_23350 [Caldilineaceae bacterium]
MEAALRNGGMALLLKRQVCLYPQHQRCVGCPLLRNCVYPAIFEPAPPPDSEVLSTHERAAAHRVAAAGGDGDSLP